MPCGRVEEVLLQLLSPGFSRHLQYYVDRFKSDPQFLFFHANSTVLRLRAELELYSGPSGPCSDCPINAVAKCDLLEALGQAIRAHLHDSKDIAA